MTNNNMDFIIREYAKMVDHTESEVKELILTKDKVVMNGLFKMACICEATIKG